MGNGPNNNHREVILTPDIILVNRWRKLALDTVRAIDERFPVETGTPEDVINRALQKFFRGQVEEALKNVESDMGSLAISEKIRQVLDGAMTKTLSDILVRVTEGNNHSESSK